MPKTSIQDTQGFPWDTAGLPLGTKGLDLRINPRNQDPTALEEINNAQFRDSSVFGRRNGHDGYEVRDSSTSLITQTGYISESNRWLMGHGRLFTTPDSVPTFELESVHCTYPGQLLGLAHRDDEVIAWTGDRLLSFPEGLPDGPWAGKSPSWIPGTTQLMGIPAVIPTSKAVVVPTSTKPEFSSTLGTDSSLGRQYYVVAFGQGTGSPLTVAAYDRFTNAAIFETDFNTASTPARVRCVFSSGYHVVYWADGDNTVHQAWAHESAIDNWTQGEDFPTIGSGNFDVVYISESTHLLIYADGTNIFGTYYHGPNGQATPFTEGTSFAVGAGDHPVDVAVAVGRNGDIGLLWYHVDGDTKTVYSSVYNAAGAQLATEIVFDDKPDDSLSGLAVSAKWLFDPTGDLSVFQGYTNHSDSGLGVQIGRFTSATVSHKNVRFNCFIASRAFRVGNESAIWLMASYNASATAFGGIVPTVLFLLVGQENLQQVSGFADWGQTYNLSYTAPSVSPDPVEGTYPMEATPTTSQWHTCSVRRQSVAGFGSKDVELVVRSLTFLPSSLRSAQYGKSTYFAGAAVRVYDGNTLTECGVALPPKVTLAADTTSGTHLTLVMPYGYRVYLTWKNAQGEICRSNAISVSQTLTSTDNFFVLTIPTIPCTDKVGAKFEIYRTEGGGTTYYYVATVDDVNDYSVAHVIYTDNATDASIRTNPIDPFNPAVGQAFEIGEDIPRGCEVLYAYGDRLFLSGGEIPRGVVDFSKYLSYGNQAGFSALYGTVVADSTGGEITSLSGMNDTPVIFTAQNVLILQGTGPDNFGNGSYLPTMAILGRGCTTHDGTVATNMGVGYWTTRGPMLLSTGFQVMEISDQIQPLASSFTPSGVVAPSNSNEIRWYSRDGRGILFDYRNGLPPGQGRWATFSGLPVAGALCRGSRQAELAMTNGFFFVENDAHETDHGSHYALTWKTGQLRPGDMVMGHNQARRVGLTGQYLGPHTLSCWAYYDGSHWYDQIFTWTPSTDVDLGCPWTEDDTPLNEATDIFSSPDGVYRFDKRLRRGPCATVSFRFSDGGPTNDSLVPHELALEIGEKPGLTPMPHRTFGGPSDPPIE